MYGTYRVLLRKKLEKPITLSTISNYNKKSESYIIYKVYSLKRYRNFNKKNESYVIYKMYSLKR